MTAKRSGCWFTSRCKLNEIPTFSFPTAKLLDFKRDLQRLEHSINPVALLVAAHLHALKTKPHSAARRQVKFRLLRNLFESGLGREQILLFFRLVDWVLVLSPANQRLFWEELKTYEMENHMPYITSVERMGIEQGRKEGLELGRSQGRAEGETAALHSALATVLSKRFGPLPDHLVTRFTAVTEPARLQNLLELAVTCINIEGFEQTID